MTPGGSLIRAERAHDRDAIRAVVEAAFGSPVEAQLVDAVRASEHFIPELSLVAELERRIVGQVMISYATLIERDSKRRIAMLSPLAVTPALHQRGVGSALVRDVTARADQLGEPVVVLEGSPICYGRFGFEPSERYGIRITLPSWAPPEAAQVMRLRAYDPSWRGQIQYPAAFDSLAHR